MHRMIVSAALALALLLLPVATRAQSGLDVTVSTESTCAVVNFSLEAQGGTAPYSLDWAFGDEETLQVTGIAAFPHQTSHTYPAQGDYLWSVAVTDTEGLTGSAQGSISLAGPTVSLSSDPFPPLATLVDGEAIVQFTAQVTGDSEPLAYRWDLDGDGTPDAGADPNSNTASFTYTAGGKYDATVTVSDGCGLAASVTLPVVVQDPEAKACHPMAQRIADAVNTLFPNQAQTLYTCEDIIAIFTGDLTGSQFGFGRLWHAYRLALTMEDLTWEEIREWHLDGNGWGLLVQLDRFTETLGDVGLRDLMGMVLSGEASVNDIRTAVRSVVRYGADFDDALARLAQGASPGELTRLYRIAESLEVAPSTLDTYLAAGMTLAEIQHSARLSERTGSDWVAVAEAHGAGASWGAIHQAQRLAGEGGGWQSMLDTGVQEFRAQLRQQAKQQRAQELSHERGQGHQPERDQQQGQDRDRDRHQDREAERRQDQDQRMAERLADQFRVNVSEVWALYNGPCGGDWGCVRDQLHGQGGPEESGRNK